MTLLFLLSIFVPAYLGLFIYPFYILFNLHSCNHYLFNFSGRQDVLPMQWHCWRGPVLCREYKLHHYRLRGNGNLCKIDIHARVNAKLFLFPLKTNYSIPYKKDSWTDRRYWNRWQRSYRYVFTRHQNCTCSPQQKRSGKGS